MWIFELFFGYQSSILGLSVDAIVLHGRIPLEGAVRARVHKRGSHGGTENITQVCEPPISEESAEPWLTRKMVVLAQMGYSGLQVADMGHNVCEQQREGSLTHYIPERWWLLAQNVGSSVFVCLFLCVSLSMFVWVTSQVLQRLFNHSATDRQGVMLGSFPCAETLSWWGGLRAIIAWPTSALNPNPTLIQFLN